ncbi:MAG: IS630 family transposase [Rhabdochlamydiaceae bacterium]
MIRKYRKLGYAIFCLDESTHVIAPNVRRGWYIKGKNIATAINYTREKFCSFGALGADDFAYRFYEKANSDNFIDFLKHLGKKYGKVLLFADNVAYHKSGKVERYIRSTKGDTVIRYFPGYTPELNPIEIQWREIKKNLGNQFFAGTDEMKDCIRKLVRTGKVPVVKLFDYLTH